jgi:hypothetical protein
VLFADDVSFSARTWLRLDQITYARVVGQCTWLRGVVSAVSDGVAVHQIYCLRVVFL